MEVRSVFCCIWIEQMVCISLSFRLFSCVNELSVETNEAYAMRLLDMLASATTLCFNKFYLVFYVASSYCSNYFK